MFHASGGKQLKQSTCEAEAQHELTAAGVPFTEDELVTVGLRTRRRGLLGLLTPLEAPTIEGAEDAGLAELWVRFLNEEVGETG